MQVSKAHFINSYTYPGSSEIQEKINYFVDCLDLFSESQSRPLGNLNLNTRLLVKALKKILASQNSYRWYYSKHFFESYKEFLSHDDPIIKKNYAELFSSIHANLKKYFSNKNKEQEYFVDLHEILNKTESELDETYFKFLVDELSLAVLCPKSLSHHKHAVTIERCVKSLIPEYYSIGYSKQEVQTVFSLAVSHNKESIEKIDKSNIYKIPVPPEIWDQRALKYDDYRNLVIQYLSNCTLPDQFKNLINIYYQSFQERTFVFKIHNLKYLEDTPFSFYEVVLAKSFTEKYASETSNENFKNFFIEEDYQAFCEIKVFSGNEESALEKAIVLAKEALNYINFDVGEKTKEASVDLRQYVVRKDNSAFLIKKSAVKVAKDDLEHAKGLFDLVNLKTHKAVAHYMNIDKIYFESFGLDTPAGSVSSLWRYCESLFVNEKDAEQIIDTLLNYYCSRTKHLKFFGAFQMINLFLHEYAYGDRHLALGMQFSEFYDKRNQDRSLEEYVRFWNQLIRHPIINGHAERVFSLTEDQTRNVLFKHYFLIIKEMYIQRNLYQHSNIVIDEIRDIWYNKLIDFVGSLRHFIIEDLKRDPAKENVEAIFKD